MLNPSEWRRFIFAIFAFENELLRLLLDGTPSAMPFRLLADLFRLPADEFVVVEMEGRRKRLDEEESWPGECLVESMMLNSWLVFKKSDLFASSSSITVKILALFFFSPNALFDS